MEEIDFEYSCDQWMPIKRNRCGRKPYCEVIAMTRDSWSYLCRWHYILARLWFILTRNKTNAFAIINEKGKDK